jgi:uncharacterized protein (DUF697 family)
MRKLGGKGLGAVGNVRNFMNVVKEIDFDEVQQRAEQPPRVLVIGISDDAARTTAEAIFGSNAGRYVDARSNESGGRIDAARYDAIIVADPENTGLLDEVKRRSTRSNSGNLLSIQRAGDPGQVANLRARVLGSTLDLAPSYGRHFPEFRPAAVKEIVGDTARANAQFALVSNIPAIVPILGGFVSASADLIVLTKNQVMMSYKIAAAHGRDLQDQGAIIRELVPVVGAGFLWRTIAREAVSFLPMAAGTIPKVVIAYAGTFSVGRAIDFYYRFGKKPTKDQLQTFAKQATETASRISLPGRAGGENPSPTPEADDDGAAKVNPS